MAKKRRKWRAIFRRQSSNLNTSVFHWFQLKLGLLMVWDINPCRLRLLKISYKNNRDKHFKHTESISQYTFTLTTWNPFHSFLSIWTILMLFKANQVVQKLEPPVTEWNAPFIHSFFKWRPESTPSQQLQFLKSANIFKGGLSFGVPSWHAWCHDSITTPEF